MVNLVIVSHSHRVAEGVQEIALQMASDEVRIGCVGGLCEANGEMVLGTDAAEIARTVRETWSDDGVLLLVDVGSAVMSAEQAVEMLTPAEAERCLISDAPLVEGAIVAAMVAGLGRSLHEVNESALLACSAPKH